MKRLYIISLLIVSTLCVFSQELTVEEIKKSGLYLYGVGLDKDMEQSNSAALDDLITQISVDVQSHFENLVSEVDGEISEITKSVVTTYSSTSLRNVPKIMERENREWMTLRYVKKEDLLLLFEERKQKIFDYTKMGENAERECRLADALRYYYWSYILLRSHPDNASIRYTFEEQSEIALIHSIPDRMNRIFAGLDFRIGDVLSSEENEDLTYILDISYDGHHVENLDFTYFQGNTQSVLNSVNDGLSDIEFFGQTAKAMDKTWLNIEYKYKDKMMDKDIQSVFNDGNKYFFPYLEKSVIELHLIKGKTKKEKEIVKVKETVELNDIDIVDNTKVFKKTIRKVSQSIINKNPASVKSYFTESGFDLFSRLLANGNVKVLGIEDTLSVVRINDEVMVRSVLMSFNYENNNRSFNERVNFIFNSDSKIDGVSFSISDRAMDDIMSKSERFAKLEEKYLLVRFIEDYKTAYCLKRLDYIESVFADNALIIVGKVLEEDPNVKVEDMYVKLRKNRIQYVKHDKKSYISGLKRVFQNNEFVNIHFEGNRVIKRNCKDEKIYGIQIEQHYSSTHYADKGYLFLAVDLTIKEQPKVYVRTWQPEIGDTDHLFSLSDFSFGDCDTIF
jgi:hypothetical protein